MLKERNFKFGNKFEDLSGKEKSRVFDLIAGFVSNEKEKVAQDGLNKEYGALCEEVANGSR